MSEIISFPLPAGPNFTIPDVGDENWGQSVTDFLVAVPNGVPPTSGTFTLTGDLYFGASFGLVSQYFKSPTINPATTGIVRLAKTDLIDWRNNANSGNLSLAINGSDQLTFNGAVIPTGGSTFISSIVGTTNEIIVNTVSTVATLSTPQPIATTSNVSFASVTASGTDGLIVGNSGSGAQAQLTLYDALGNAATIFAPTGLSPYTLILPIVGPSANDTLHSDSLGNLSFSPVSLTVDVSGTLPIASGGTNKTSFTAYSVLCGGTTTTGALQSVSGVGSSGQVLTSNGASALPTWQPVAGGGTVNSGTAGNFSYYATSTNAVSDSGVSISAPVFSGTATALTVKHTQATNQMSFQNGAGHITTITVPAPAATTQVYTVPDVGTNSSFTMLDGAQTLPGVKTFSGGAGAITLSSSTIAMGTNKITGLANGTASTDAATFAQIKVLQAGIQTASAVSVTTTSSTFTAVTGLTVSITPTSASNRVRITVNSEASISTTGGVSWTLKRGTTELSGVANGFGLLNPSGGANYPIAFTYIDSPATTSSTAYQLFFRSNDNSSTAQVGRSDILSIIIAEEIV